MRKQSDSANILGTWHVSDPEHGHVLLENLRSTPERRQSDYAVTGGGQVRARRYPDDKIFIYLNGLNLKDRSKKFLYCFPLSIRDV